MKDNKSSNIKIIPIRKYEFTEEEIKFALLYAKRNKIIKEILPRLDTPLEDELLNF